MLLDGKVPPVVRTATTTTAKTAALACGYWLIFNLDSSADHIHWAIGPQASVEAATTNGKLAPGKTVMVHIDPNGATADDTIAVICPTSTATVHILRVRAP